MMSNYYLSFMIEIYWKRISQNHTIYSNDCEYQTINSTSWQFCECIAMVYSLLNIFKYEIQIQFAFDSNLYNVQSNWIYSELLIFININIKQPIAIWNQKFGNAKPIAKHEQQ